MLGMINLTAQGNLQVAEAQKKSISLAKSIGLLGKELGSSRADTTQLGEVVSGRQARWRGGQVSSAGTKGFIPATCPKCNTEARM